MARWGALLAVLAPALLAGCGHAQSESERVRSVVEQYFAGLAGGRGKDVCALLTREAREQMQRGATIVAVPIARAHLKIAPGCAGFVELYAKALAGESDTRERAARVRIGWPSIAGTNASVRVQEPGEPAKLIPLVKTAAGWRVQGLHVGFAQPISGGPTALELQPPSAVAKAGGKTLDEFDLGRTVTAQSGCLACHRIGANGNAGPGPDLTHVGSKLPSSAIEHALTDPTAPMPSFRKLPRAKLRAIVEFLSLLR